MIGVTLKILVLGAAVVLLACSIGLFIMAGVAQSHDVVRIPLPPNTFIAGTQSMADESDAYVGIMKYASFRDIERVAQQAFHRGEKEVYRDEREVTYEGTGPGITYHVSYILMKNPEPQTLTVATTVTFTEKKSRYYWKVYKQVHRALLAYMLDRMIIMAPD